jgi:polysaccharide pyruvyl transferase WcaK-like protein
MIWNMDVNGYDYSFFLDFVKDHKRKISYGSSVGGIWSDKQMEGVKKYLSKYDSIAVREKDTCQTMEKELKLSCTTVADPTMLYTAADWNQYTLDMKEKNYVLVYFPTTELIEAARKYSLDHDKKLIILQTRLPFKRMNSKTIYSPSEWMSYIKNADAVFTDSYHGLLFSLYFNRPVWTNNNSNRISTLLEELGLNTCYIKNDKGLTNHIDYDRCNKKIEIMRNSSLDYLKSVLEG